MGRGSTARRAAGRLGLASCGVVTAVAIAEAAVRTLRLDHYERPLLRTSRPHDVAALERVYQFFTETRESGGGSLTQMPATFVAYGWYDRPKWEYFDEDGCVEYRTNSLGFRDHEFPHDRPPGELRILALGDSFTFGQGVQAADCWVERVEQGLARVHPGPVEVVNCGYGFGFAPDRYAEWLEKHGLGLDPDALLLGICLNDLFTDVQLVARHPEHATMREAKLRVVTMARRALARLDEPPPVPRYNVTKAAKRLPKDIEAFRRGIASLSRISRERGLRLVAFVFPMLTELRGAYPYSDLHELARAICAENDVECVDLLERFRGRDERELWAHPTDQHPNDVGHQLIAEGILEHLAARPIAPRARDGADGSR